MQLQELQKLCALQACGYMYVCIVKRCDRAHLDSILEGVVAFADLLRSYT